MLPNHVPNEEVLQDYIKAGKIAAAALRFGKEQIKEGVKIKDVLEATEAFIKEQGAKPAFPAQISLNTTAAHACAREDDETTFQKTDIVKLDVGVHVNGYVGDNAVTINLDPKNKEAQQLVEASKAARDAAIKIIKAGITPHEIGKVIEEEITKRGFEPIRNLSGHGVGQYQIHTSPSIPNYGNEDTHPLEENQVFAIEPFATTGKGMIHSVGEATIYTLTRIKPIRNTLARPVLERIKTYKGLPFTKRWLTKEFGLPRTHMALQALKQASILQEYPPLVEVSDGLVSQSEHTVLVTKEGVRILTT